MPTLIKTILFTVGFVLSLLTFLATLVVFFQEMRDPDPSPFSPKGQFLMFTYLITILFSISLLIASLF